MTEWRCFQCGEVLTDEQSALKHFGRYEVLSPPLCCDRSLATFDQVIEELRREQVQSQVMYRQKYETEKEVERLRKIEAAARALQFSAYPAHGSGFVITVTGGNINDLEATLKAHE